jgi:hypothetical protein
VALVGVDLITGERLLPPGEREYAGFGKNRRDEIERTAASIRRLFCLIVIVQQYNHSRATIVLLLHHLHLQVQSPY